MKVWYTFTGWYVITHEQHRYFRRGRHTKASNSGLSQHLKNKQIQAEAERNIAQKNKFEPNHGATYKTHTKYINGMLNKEHLKEHSTENFGSTHGKNLKFYLE